MKSKHVPERAFRFFDVFSGDNGGRTSREILPHPGPLPQGEGESFADFGDDQRRSLPGGFVPSEHAYWRFPSPSGRGIKGEGGSFPFVKGFARAFTMIELLVVIAIIGILASLLLPSLMQAKKRPDQIMCINNQRQIGAAMVMFMSDNSDTIPGPCYMGVSQKYYQIGRDFENFGGGMEVGPTELIGYLAPHLSLPAPPDAPEKATGKVAVCPGFVKIAPNPPPNPRQEGYSYFCNRIKISPRPDSGDPMDWFEFPFGYLNGKLKVTRKPKKMQEIRTPSDTWAIMDADKITVTFGTWQTNLPNRRAHGAVWNRLYFDGHAASVKKLN